MTEYKNTKDMSTEELVTIVDLIVELDKLAEGESPEKQIGLVTTIQKLIRTPEAVAAAEEDAVAELIAEEVAEAPEKEDTETEAEAV